MSGVLKPEKDFSKDADKLIPEAEQLAKTDVQGAIDKLLLLEKQARQSSDLPTTSRLLVTIVTISKNTGDWNLLNDQVLLLSKKHGQLKQAISRMVQTVMSFLDETPNMETKLSVIQTLRTVTEGKIFVEVERARVTRILSQIKKSQGDLNAAADILCELQVETFGSMTRREKTEFILEQVALCIERGDWTQATVLSRKINKRYFARKPKKSAEEIEKLKKEAEEREKTRAPDEAPMEVDDDVTDLKLRYYEQQIILANHDYKYLDVCKHYREVLDTDSVQENPEQLRAVLARIVYYIVLSPYDNEQSDLLHRIQQDTRLSAVPVESRLVKLFTVPELMRWPIVAEHFWLLIQSFKPNMIHSKVLFLAPVISSLAQDLPTDIVGCKDLDCPNEGWDSCTVADETYAGVGLARVSNAPDSLAGISLVKGVHIEDPKSGGNAGGDGSEESRSFRSVYYLGTPSNLEVADVSGCAVVFNDPPTGHFDVPKLNDSITVDTRASYGTCPDVIQQGCIEGLTRQAGKLQYSGSNACSALASDLRNNPPDECSDMTGSGDGLGSFDVVSLSNLSTISQSANGSSNCWPILPKTDNLAQLYDDTTKGNYTEQGNLAEMYKITPILTVFTSDNSTNSPVNNTAASLTCLKVVGTQDVTNATDPTDTDVDAAPLSAVNMVGASVAAIATLIFVLL